MTTTKLTPKAYFTEEGYTAQIDYSPSGIDYITINKDGEEVENEELEDIVENLVNDYLNKYHPYCDEGQGARGTIFIDEEGIEDDLVYNDNDVEETIVEITNPSIVSLLNQIGGEEKYEEYIQFSIEDSGIGYFSFIHQRPVNIQLNEDISSALNNEPTFQSFLDNHQERSVDTAYVSKRQDQWLLTCFFETNEDKANSKKWD